MVWMRIKAYRSPDKRLRTETFKSEQGRVFCIAEPTAWGTLVSKFRASGEIVDRVENERTRNASSALDMYLTGFGMLEIVDVERFERVKANAVCSVCGGTDICREQDMQETGELHGTPVVPIFACASCGTRFCLVGDDYIKTLISRFSRYITMDKGQHADNGAFVGSVKDSIIRSFASQNIKELVIKATA